MARSPKPEKVKKRVENYPIAWDGVFAGKHLFLVCQLASVSLNWSVFRFEGLRLSATLLSLRLLGSRQATEYKELNCMLYSVQIIP